MNNAALVDVLRRSTGDTTLVLDGEPETLTGGFWAELVAFRVAGCEQPLVARFMPDPVTGAKETAVQMAVARLGFPTPAVHAWGGPDVGDGRAFVIMERVAGSPVLGGLDGAGALRRGPELLRRIPEVLGSTLATLHRLDPAPVRVELATVGADTADAGGFLALLEARAVVAGREDLVAVAKWLAAHPPPSAPAVVCHGDFHPFNVLVDAAGRPTVLDWSASLLAPREYDIAFTELLLGDPPLAVPATLRPLVRLVGAALVRRFRTQYVAASGVALDADRFTWFTALVRLRCLTEVAGWVAAGEVDARAGHPWLLLGPRFARRLARTTGVAVRAR